MTYYYEVSARGISLMAIGGDWTGAEVVAFRPHDACYCKEGCVLMEPHEQCVTEDEMGCQCGHSLAQHTKGPVRATYCRHCPCPEWEPK